MAIDGRSLPDQATLDAIVSGLEPAAVVEIRYWSRGEERVAKVSVGEDPTLVGRWMADDVVTPEQSAFRASWRGSAED